MRILLTVEFYNLPAAGGMAEQVRCIAEELVHHGHEVTVATSKLQNQSKSHHGVAIEGFKISGNAVKGIKGEVDHYREFLINNKFDVVINFAANIWTTDIAFEVLDRIKGKKILSSPGLSKLYHPSYKDYNYGPYLRALEKYDRVIYTSANYRDKQFGDLQGFGDKAVIIPNGAAEEEFLSPGIDFRSAFAIKTPLLFLSVSNHYFAKGHAMVIDAFKRMNRKDATLVVIGERPVCNSWYSCEPFCFLKSKFTSLPIKILSGLSRQQVTSAFREADAFLFGSRLECAPLVMYESFASRTPFITTNVGNVGDYRNLIKIVDSADEMSSAANSVIESKKEWKDKCSEAFSLWENNYTWKKIGKQYAALCDEIA